MGLGIDREKDIEELRRIAQALELQNEILIRTLEAKCRELEALKGREGELQQTLALLNSLTKKAATTTAPPKKGKSRLAKKPRDKAGPTDQPRLPAVEQVSSSTPRIEPARAAAASSIRWMVSSRPPR